jgi:hypothetical protein
VGIIADAEISIQKLAKIHADIEELPMLYKIDLVDFNEVGEQFKSIALQNIEPL